MRSAGVYPGYTTLAEGFEKCTIIGFLLSLRVPAKGLDFQTASLFQVARAIERTHAEPCLIFSDANLADRVLGLRGCKTLNCQHIHPNIIQIRAWFQGVQSFGTA